MTAPTTGRRERKKAATRRAIADAALALFLEHGYHDVTIKQIADAADVAVATVFAYFPDGKQALVFDEDGDRETQLVATVLERPPGQSILDALEEQGVSVLSSCQEGVCGTCETRVLEGIPDHRDSLLSEEEREANEYMMICVGRSKSDRLVLDL